MFSNVNKSNESVAKRTMEKEPGSLAHKSASPSSMKHPPRKQEQQGTYSVLSSDLFVKGNLKSATDIKIEGQVEGDIRSQLLTIGEQATVKGHMTAEEVIVNGCVIGQVRGIRVRLNASARVEGDIIHETISIEGGAHFEGTVKRQENPLKDSAPVRTKQPQTVQPQPTTKTG